MNTDDAATLDHKQLERLQGLHLSPNLIKSPPPPAPTTPARGAQHSSQVYGDAFSHGWIREAVPHTPLARSLATLEVCIGYMLDDKRPMSTNKRAIHSAADVERFYSDMYRMGSPTNFYHELAFCAGWGSGNFLDAVVDKLDMVCEVDMGGGVMVGRFKTIWHCMFWCIKRYEAEHSAVAEVVVRGSNCNRFIERNWGIAKEYLEQWILL